MIDTISSHPSMIVPTAEKEKILKEKLVELGCKFYPTLLEEDDEAEKIKDESIRAIETNDRLEKEHKEEIIKFINKLWTYLERPIVTKAFPEAEPGEAHLTRRIWRDSLFKTDEDLFYYFKRSKLRINVLNTFLISVDRFIYFLRRVMHDDSLASQIEVIRKEVLPTKSNEDFDNIENPKKQKETLTLLREYEEGCIIIFEILKKYYSR